MGGRLGGLVLGVMVGLTAISRAEAQTCTPLSSQENSLINVYTVATCTQVPALFYKYADLYKAYPSLSTSYRQIADFYAANCKLADTARAKAVAYQQCLANKAKPAPTPAPVAPPKPVSPTNPTTPSTPAPSPAPAPVVQSNTCGLVYVVDTGINYNHPELSAYVNRTKGRNFINNTTNSMDDQSHGSHVAGIIGGKSNTASRFNGGQCKNGVELVGYKVLDSRGSGTSSAIISALQAIANNHQANGAAFTSNHAYSILNGTTFEKNAYGQYSNTFAYYIDQVVKKNGVFVVAAGNDGRTRNEDRSRAPAAMISVGAIDLSRNIASFSNRGTIVDVFAYGVNVNSTVLGSGYASYSGTSMAAPDVSGMVARLLKMNPNWTNIDVANYIRSKGVPASYGKSLLTGDVFK